MTDPAYGCVATMLDGTGSTSYIYHPVGTFGAGVDGPLADDPVTYTYDAHAERRRARPTASV